MDYEVWQDNLENRAKKKAKSQVKRAAKKKIRRIHPLSFGVWIVVLALGIGLGVGVYTWLCREDTFTVIGDKEIVISVGKGQVLYEDRGARVISFGRDVSDRVVAETSLPEGDEEGSYVIDTSEEGVYSIVYTVEDPRFGEVRRVRVIRVVQAEAGES